MPRLLLVVLLLSTSAWAYVDPGTAGLLFQIGYAVFYGLLAALAFMFRPIKNFFSALKARFRRRTEPASHSDANDTD